MTYDVGDASVIEAGADTSSPGDAADETPPPNEAGIDAPVDPCDQDKDGYKSSSCGGNDCNDNDPRVNPGVTGFVNDVPDAFPWGDWNCDGTVQYQYPSVTCAVTCSGSEGFGSSPGCGFSAEYVDCSGVPCSLADAGTRQQGCL